VDSEEPQLSWSPSPSQHNFLRLLVPYTSPMATTALVAEDLNQVCVCSFETFRAADVERSGPRDDQEYEGTQPSARTPWVP
jgi:hypothetical protein